MSRSSGGHAGSTQLHNSISFVSTCPPKPSLSSASPHPLFSPPKKFQQKSPQKKKQKNKKKSYSCSSFSNYSLAEILHKKTKKKNSANARREELEKHWHRLQEEACVVD